MKHIVKNINELRSNVPAHVKIVAVSKTKTLSEIHEAMKAGLVFFGESKMQELTAKYEQAPDIQWHFIGHLQTNKVKYIVPFVKMIQSVDSLRVLKEIDLQARKHNRVVDCLLQMHIAREENKFGFSEREIFYLMEDSNFTDLKNVRICGMMGMATFTDDMDAVRMEFRKFANFFKHIKNTYYPSELSFCELSMGMSDDYHVAIEEGATMVRIGSSIFDKKN